MLLLSSKSRATSTRGWSRKVPLARMSFSTRAGAASEKGAPAGVEEGEGWWQRLALSSNSVISEMEPSELEALFAKVLKAARGRRVSVDEDSILVILCQRSSALSPTDMSLRQACGFLNAISTLAHDVPVSAELEPAVANLIEIIAQGCRGKHDGHAPDLSLADIAMSVRALSRLKLKASPAYSDLIQMAIHSSDEGWDRASVVTLLSLLARDDSKSHTNRRLGIKLSHWCAHNVDAFDGEGLVSCVHLAARAVPPEHVDSLLKCAVRRFGIHRSQLIDLTPSSLASLMNTIGLHVRKYSKVTDESHWMAAELPVFVTHHEHAVDDIGLNNFSHKQLCWLLRGYTEVKQLEVSKNTSGDVIIRRRKQSIDALPTAIADKLLASALTRGIWAGLTVEVLARSYGIFHQRLGKFTKGIKHVDGKDISRACIASVMDLVDGLSRNVGAYHVCCDFLGMASRDDENLRRLSEEERNRLSEILKVWREENA